MPTILVATLTLLLPSPAVEAASSPERMELDRLAREATAIAHIRVLSARAAWDAERRIIWTSYLCRVQATWKGSLPRRFVLRAPGGVIGSIGQRVSGTPSYRPGEERVIFLTRDALGQWRTLGGFQGAFPVQSRIDGSPGVRFIRGLAHVTAKAFPPRGARRRVGVGLAVFERAVKQLAARPRVEPEPEPEPEPETEPEEGR